jgi:ketol-acid reductoisomerase
MRTVVEGIRSGAFADEWDAERDAGFERFHALKEQAVGEAVQAFERDLRRRLGELSR